MKKTSPTKAPPSEAVEMLAEYKFDYSKARPNRFAGRISKERVVVILDPDVSEVFTTPEAVNSAFRPPCQKASSGGLVRSERACENMWR